MTDELTITAEVEAHIILRLGEYTTYLPTRDVEYARIIKNAALAVGGNPGAILGYLMGYWIGHAGRSGEKMHAARQLILNTMFIGSDRGPPWGFSMDFTSDPRKRDE